MFLLIDTQTPMWDLLITYILPPVITGVISAFVAIMVSRRDLRKLEKSHQLELDKLLKEKQVQLDLEKDKIQAEAFRGMHQPLKYLGKNPDNPYSMFGVNSNQDGKETFLIREKGQEFLQSVNDYLYGDTGSLFLPKELRYSLFAMRGIVYNLINENENDEEITVNNKNVVKQINELTSGENCVHKQLRHLMGTAKKIIKHVNAN